MLYMLVDSSINFKVMEIGKLSVPSKVLGFPERGMEVIYEFDARGMPVTVTVAVAVNGESVNKIGPQIWKQGIELGNI